MVKPMGAVEAPLALKPCPFCGEGRISISHVRDGQVARCLDCGASSGPCYHGPGLSDDPWDTHKRAAAAWNARVAEPPEGEKT